MEATGSAKTETTECGPLFKITYKANQPHIQLREITLIVRGEDAIKAEEYANTVLGMAYLSPHFVPWETYEMGGTG